jgi:hypothetical protein
MPESKFGVQGDPRFHIALGLFHAAWSSIDLTLDCSIARFLGISPEQTLLLTAGMELGRKIRLVIGLANRSDHPQKAAMVGALNKLQNESKRTVFAHSYIYSDGDKVVFLERKANETRVFKHTFTLVEFATHVNDFTTAGRALWSSSGVTDADMQTFIKAALEKVPA